MQNTTLIVQIHRFGFLVHPPSLRASPAIKIVSILLGLYAFSSRAGSRTSISFQTAFGIQCIDSFPRSPASLPREALVEQCEDFRHIELHVLQVQILLAFFLHLEQIVQLQIQLQKTPVTALVV
jgi:hypothetical protein